MSPQPKCPNTTTRTPRYDYPVRRASSTTLGIQQSEEQTNQNLRPLVHSRSQPPGSNPDRMKKSQAPGRHSSRYQHTKAPKQYAYYSSHKNAPAAVSLLAKNKKQTKAPSSTPEKEGHPTKQTVTKKGIHDKDNDEVFPIEPPSPEWPPQVLPPDWQSRPPRDSSNRVKEVDPETSTTEATALTSDPTTTARSDEAATTTSPSVNIGATSTIKTTTGSTEAAWSDSTSHEDSSATTTAATLLVTESTSTSSTTTITSLTVSTLAQSLDTDDDDTLTRRTSLIDTATSETDATITASDSDVSFTTDPPTSSQTLELPSTVPLGLPSTAPSELPSIVPSELPSTVPSDLPSTVPSEVPLPPLPSRYEFEYTRGDAHVRQERPTDNFGRDQLWHVGFDTRHNRDEIAYLRFDLRALNGWVTDAGIWLYVQRRDISGGPNRDVTLQMFPFMDVNQDWNPKKITWNTRPALQENHPIWTGTVRNPGQWMWLDITDYLNALLQQDPTQLFFFSLGLVLVKNQESSSVSS
eukprot:CAMPEP_0172468580 /NCGR_PEP_ID=MMETSP1065-20121228/61595_1 /TAXON_ID=265537 /ORGANISM="Amphiprora paludosa, Strain CCMP125" /LENGTH=522 /DNA_ID=CAMNT_0013225997 /DNA_START=44 /DNA_END=1608 /DNA_ORIENTATION=+